MERTVSVAELCDMDPMRIEVSQAMRMTHPEEGGVGLDVVRVLSIYERQVTHGSTGSRQHWKLAIKNLSFEDGDMTTAEILRHLADLLES
jgi:hypothetical protein